MRHRIVLTLLLAVPCAGSAQETAEIEAEAARHYRPHTSSNRYSRFMMTFFELVGPGRHWTCSAEGKIEPTVNLIYAMNRDGVETLSLHATVIAKGWLFIGGDHPMRLTVGDLALEITAGRTNTRQSIAGGRISETEGYIVQPQHVSLLMRADSARLHVGGERGSCETRLTPVHAAMVRMFVNRDLPPSVRAEILAH